MITNIRIELSDHERELVHAAVYDKLIPVTRKQLQEIVDMAIEQLIRKGQQREYQHLEPGVLPRVPSRGKPAKPHDASYMRGWNQIGDAIAKGILK